MLFPNNSEVEKQKRKHNKYCVTVRQQSEKYHTKPKVMAMEKRHRYIFFSYKRLFFARISYFETVCVAHSQSRSVHGHLWHRRRRLGFLKQQSNVINSQTLLSWVKQSCDWLQVVRACLLLIIAGCHLQVTPLPYSKELWSIYLDYQWWECSDPIFE